MNWRKILKYTLLIFLLLIIIGVYSMNRQGKLIYGGLTHVVDHKQFHPQTGSFAIKDASVLALDGERFIKGQTVFLDQGTITAIDSTSTIPSRYTVIDGAGKFLIPGLIDSHVHLFKSQNDLLLYIANGVTEIRELIGDDDQLKWREEINKGRIGPKMFVASPRLGSFEKLEGWFMSWSQGYMNIRNADEARKQVMNLHKKGYDGIKIYSQLNKESYLSIIETANSLDMPVMGHIPWQLSFSDIWTNGQKDIAHFEEIMNALQREFNPSHDQRFGSFAGKEEEFLEYIEQRCGELAEQLIKNEIAVTSTLWLNGTFVRQKFELDQVLKEVELAYENPGISEWVSYIPQGLGWLPDVNRYKIHENNLNEEELVGHKKYWDTYGKACQKVAYELAKRGVQIMAGTDANLPPTVPGFSLHDELISLNNAGMSTSQVLKSATAIPSKWMKSNAGKLAPGYIANMVLLDKNPLEKIENTKTINTVISKGSVYDRPLLDAMLAAVKEANDMCRKVDISEYE